MSYKHNFQPGQLIEEKSTGSLGIIVSIKTGKWATSRELVRYYLLYVPQNPRYMHTIVCDRPAILNSHYRVIT
jgi:hypothetical protein